MHCHQSCVPIILAISHRLTKRYGTKRRLRGKVQIFNKMVNSARHQSELEHLKRLSNELCRIHPTSISLAKHLFSKYLIVILTLSPFLAFFSVSLSITPYLWFIPFLLAPWPAYMRRSSLLKEVQGEIMVELIIFNLIRPESLESLVSRLEKDPFIYLWFSKNDNNKHVLKHIDSCSYWIHHGGNHNLVPIKQGCEYFQYSTKC